MIQITPPRPSMSKAQNASAFDPLLSRHVMTESFLLVAKRAGGITWTRPDYPLVALICDPNFGRVLLLRPSSSLFPGGCFLQHPPESFFSAATYLTSSFAAPSVAVPVPATRYNFLSVLYVSFCQVDSGDTIQVHVFVWFTALSLRVFFIFSVSAD